MSLSFFFKKKVRYINYSVLLGMDSEEHILPTGSVKSDCLRSLEALYV